METKKNYLRKKTKTSDTISDGSISLVKKNDSRLLPGLFQGSAILEKQ